MTQTAVKSVQSSGDTIDYTPTSVVVAGAVVEIGSIPVIATQAIVANVQGSLAFEGVFDVPKTSDVFAVGDAVYWNSSATDVGSNTGAADNSTGNLMGLATANAANTATHVRTKLTAAKRTTTIGGAVTATDITGEDSSLAITGIAANAGAGGAIAIAGAPGDSGAGGAITVTGGAGDTAGAGGAVTTTGGVGAAGAGGAIITVAGAGHTNGAGGAVSHLAGAGAGTGDGGAATLVAGAAGTTGDGGAITITGGAGPVAGNVGGAITILSGAGDGTNGTAGAIIIDSSGTGATKGAITIGTNAATLSFGALPRLTGLVGTVNAAGGNIATAGALLEGVNIVAASDNAKGVQLPSCVDGAQCVVINMVTDKTLLIYPPLGKQVNLAAANTAINVAANTIGHFYSEGANAWYGLHAATDVA